MIKKLIGGIIYTLGFILTVIRPPVDRVACMTLPGGEVCEGINMFFLLLETGIVLVGATLITLGHNFKSKCKERGWIFLAGGLGIGFIGGYSRILEVALFGAMLVTLGVMEVRK
ncbi:hypothetical protein PFC_00635 [Pyrococcus furiosus COM1]|nr:hypothetical protein [Pyrococcus furiosus]AFN03101.1 hypothetical protein PFC_00635 [Pyrococcus furiosus COM1]